MRQQLECAMSVSTEKSPTSIALSEHETPRLAPLGDTSKRLSFSGTPASSSIDTPALDHCLIVQQDAIVHLSERSLKLDCD